MPHPRAGRRTLLVLALASCAAAGAARAAEKVVVRAWDHEGFGRIVFDWPALVNHSATVADGRLIVRFDRAMETALDDVRRNLAPYIRDVRVSDDRKSVVAALRGALRVRSFINDSAVVVDLLRPPDAATTTLGDGPAGRGPAGSVLGIRAGRHASFGRLVFDWRRMVEYRLRKSGERVDIDFDGAASPDVSGLPDALPDRIVSVSARSTPRGLHIGLVVPKTARVRHFRDATRVVVDILYRPRPPGHGAARTGPATDGGRPASSRPTSLAPPATADPPSGTGSAVQVLGPPPGSAKGTGGLVSVDVEGGGSSLAIRFNWRHDVAAAVYRRQDNLWVFFNEFARVDLGGIRYKGRGLVHEAEQFRLDGAVLVKLVVPPQVALSVGHDGLNWTLQIGAEDRDEPRKEGIQVQAEEDSQGRARLVVPLAGAVKHLRLRDPEVGDSLEIVPVTKVGHGVVEPRRFVDLELFASYQGVAIRPIAHDLSVRAGESGIVITRPGGLNVSSGEDIARLAGRAAANRTLGDIEGWQRGPTGEFERLRQQLISRVIEQPKAKRNAARLDLAKFYLSHRMAAEAIGVLRIIEREDAREAREPIFRALQGAANYLLAHYGDAAASFADARLTHERSVWPWLAGIAAARGDWRQAYARFQDTDPVIAGYPDWLAIHFLSLSIEASLTVGDLKKAKRHLATATQVNATAEQRAYLGYLRAFLLKKSGETDKALADWKALSVNPSRRVRARATFARVETLLEHKKIEPEKAIDRLERLSFTWRGDAFEFDLLRRLGDLYVATGDYRRALLRYRKAAANFEKVRGAQAITHKMSETFRKLYVEGGADALPPVTALALFEEFRELTPSGAAGDEMIRKLADRLATVDLLGEAGALLTHQIRYRLKGREKARVAARLAMIHLLDHEPLKALKALRESAVSGLPAELARRRRLFEVRALAELGRTDQALARLGDDPSDEARQLRLGVYWRGAKWAEAAALLEKTMADRKVAPGDGEATLTVLKWAVALALANDDAGLKRLGKRHGEAMAKSRHADAFRAIVGRRAEDVSDFRDLVRQAGDLDSFRTFLTGYRERVRNTPLSEIN